MAKRYRAIDSYLNYKKGDIVSEVDALQLLSRYMRITDQQLISAEESYEDVVVKNEKGETFEEVMSKEKSPKVKKSRR